MRRSTLGRGKVKISITSNRVSKSVENDEKGLFKTSIGSNRVLKPEEKNEKRSVITSIGLNITSKPEEKLEKRLVKTSIGSSHVLKPDEKDEKRLKMKKSSLGRRSSTHIPVRVPSLGGSASGQRTCSSKKSEGLLRPGFTQSGGRNRRSQSEDRESYGGRPAYSRSNTMPRISNLGAMTPITPRQPVNSNLPTGSVRKPRNQTTSTESQRRMSSFGGTKRKDMRPISEKPFQQAAQAKVQQYFDMYASEIIGPGNSIRPMNTKLFVDMMDHLLKNLDSRIVLTKSNYLEELPTLLRKLGYRSKVDRSWLMTVNTPHSWQHVLAVLSWLVELKEIMDGVDVFDMMYPSNIESQDNEDSDEDDESIKINKELILHLKKTYQMRHTEDPLGDGLVSMDSEFLENKIKEMGCTDEDLDTLQRQLDLLREEVENETKLRNEHLEELEKLQAKEKAAKADIQSLEEFIEKSKTFVETIDVKLKTKEKEIALKKTMLEKKREDLQKIQEKVNCQQISLEEKDKLNKEKHDLQRMINYHENCIREYENSVFSINLKLAEDQRKLEKCFVEYNKLVAENVIIEPRLKDAEVKLQCLTECSDNTMDNINSILKSLKEEYKTSITQLEEKKQECENILWKTSQDIETVEEDIQKETCLLEEIECDFAKNQELANRETQKLKDELSRQEKMTREIAEEISQFDPAKLEEKRLELKKLEHDHLLVQRRIKYFFGELIKTQEETTTEIAAAMAKWEERLNKFEQDHLC